MLSFYFVCMPEDHEKPVIIENGEIRLMARGRRSATANHLLQCSAAGAAPALPADPVPRAARARRPSREAGADANTGKGPASSLQFGSIQL